MKIPVIELTPQKLKWLRRIFYPGGSGPLLPMRYIVGLIDAIVKDKGWNLEEVEESPE